MPTWELGVVLDRGHNEILVCGGVVFRKLEDRRTVINLGFYQQLRITNSLFVVDSTVASRIAEDSNNHQN